jgi:hypothetical protein
MENITVELNGIKYLLVEELIASDTDEDFFQEKLQKFECIYQGVKNIKTGLFSGHHLIMKILVPEKNVIAYNKSMLQI